MHVEENVPLAPLTTLGVGGPARFYTRASSEAEVIEALIWARHQDVAPFFLGGGSNLVIADAGLEALVIHLALRGAAIEWQSKDAATLRVAAGEPWDDVVRRAVSEGLAGIECLAGIPGLAGATPIQNVGAYGQEVGDVIEKVVAIDLVTGERTELDAAACAFSYRDSAFKRGLRGRLFVSEIQLSLRAGPPSAPTYAELSRALASETLTLEAVRAKVIELRRGKAMVLGDGTGPDDKSVGSFFMNPIVEPSAADQVEEKARALGAIRAGESMPRFGAQRIASPDGRPVDGVKLAAGWLIEKAGFVKGTSRGVVGLSTKHALAIVNRGGATASDVVTFAREIRGGVEERFGVRLQAEPELVGFDQGLR